MFNSADFNQILKLFDGDILGFNLYFLGFNLYLFISIKKLHKLITS